MNHTTLKSLHAGCAVAFAALYMITASAQTPTSAPTAPPASTSQESMQKSGDMGMDGMSKMSMSTDPDKNFAMMMKMHHQKAIKMAQKELANGKSAEIKAMAKKIIAAQKHEIADFDQWLAQQK